MLRSESDARRAIVDYAALLWTRGLVAGNSGNVSVRLDDGTLLVTPSGVSLRCLAPSEVVATDPTGRPRAGAGRPTSELPLHIAAYRVRPDARCVIHTHPTYCVAWSKTGALFARDTVGAIESLGSIAWTPYARSGTPELAAICSAAFATPCDTIVMERHGLSSLAADLETAFVRTDLAEQTARIEYAARLLVDRPAPQASARAAVESGDHE
ncbi:MAG: aldolase [Vulcanimicrobiaceae bacterium]